MFIDLKEPLSKYMQDALFYYKKLITNNFFKKLQTTATDYVNLHY